MANCWSVLLLWLAFAATAAPPRVITLAPNLTELAFAAGMTPVGVSDYSDYPPAAKTLPRVANWQGINIERLLSLHPDLVFALHGATSLQPMQQLQSLGIRVIWIQTDSIAQLTASLRQMATWSPTPQQAEQQAATLEQQFQDLRQRYQNPKHTHIFLQFSQHPLFTASANTLQSEILQLCGGKNIFAESKVPWPQVSREQVLIRHPQAIVIPGESSRATEAARFWQPQLTVPVFTIKEEWFSRAGPRIILGAQQLCAQLQTEIEE